MFAIVLLGLLACAGASPRWRHRPHYQPSPFDGSLERYLNEEMFDTGRFWEDMNRDLQREMAQLETMLTNFNSHFPSMVSTEGIRGDEYKIEIPLVGYSEREIVVKARRGMLMIQAVHSAAGAKQNSYLDVRTLPACVGEQGKWSYENGVLKITLPVNRDSDEGTVLQSVTPEPENRSREETERPTADGSADIDEIRPAGKLDDAQTNEIPNVEATTYAVDLKGDVEFVPVRY